MTINIKIPEQTFTLDQQGYGRIRFEIAGEEVETEVALELEPEVSVEAPVEAEVEPEAVIATE